jgi:hypothetical protein
MDNTRVPSTRRVKARIRIVNNWGKRALNCGNCGRRLPHLSCFPNVSPERLASDGFPHSPNRCYIPDEEIRGWKIDGITLRPTEYSLQEQKQTREKVRTTPRTQTRRDRLLLAGRPPQDYPFAAKRLARTRDIDWLIDTSHSRNPGMRPAPQVVECLQCHVENDVEVDSTMHDDVV